MTATFSQLQDKVSKMPRERGNLADRLDNILDRARINADDTCYVEKARPDTDYDRVALDTVADILSYESDEAARRWFADNGVNW